MSLRYLAVELKILHEDNLILFKDIKMPNQPVVGMSIFTTAHGSVGADPIFLLSKGNEKKVKCLCLKVIDVIYDDTMTIYRASVVITSKTYELN